MFILMRRTARPSRPWNVVGLVLAAFMPLLPGAGCASASTDEAAMVLAVTPEVWVERGGDRIPLEPKMGLETSDTVVSGPTGKAQLLFADDSAVTVSPSSSLSIEDFAYDEGGDAADNRSSLRLGQGMARFITGEVARRNPQGVAVHTLHATIGIRGTTFLVNANTSDMVVTLQETSGQGLSITNLYTNTVSTLDRKGFSMEVGPAGTTERPATIGEMAANNQGTRSVGIGGLSAQGRNAFASLGNLYGPVGPAGDSGVLREDRRNELPTETSPGEVPQPGLDVAAIRGWFGTGLVRNAQFSQGWAASFEVNGAAAISHARLVVLDYALSYANGSGGIGSDGKFTVAGLTAAGSGGNLAHPAWTAGMDGEFSAENGGSLQWALSGGSLPEALTGGAHAAFAPLETGGLDVNAISGGFTAPLSGTAFFSAGGAASYTGLIYFEVDGQANIAQGRIELDLTSGGTHSGTPSASGGTGIILDGGAFSLGGFSLNPDGAYTPASAFLNGQFDTAASGKFDWGMELGASGTSDGEGTATVGGSNMPFAAGG